MQQPPATGGGVVGPLTFPKWTNSLRVVFAVAAGVAPVYLVLLVAYGASPKTTDVGYAPPQPVAYSHALHAGKLGIDCRYCHTTVDDSPHASVPPTQTCMNCHANIKIKDSPKLTPVLESYATGMPIEWVRVHDLPDYAYFNHSAHVRRGIGCVSCHGRVDKMETVYQAEPLSMSWCLECHRRPEMRLRPVEEVTNMRYMAADQAEEGRRLCELYSISPSTNCSTCHR